MSQIYGEDWLEQVAPAAEQDSDMQLEKPATEQRTSAAELPFDTEYEDDLDRQPSNVSEDALMRGGVQGDDPISNLVPGGPFVGGKNAAPLPRYDSELSLGGHDPDLRPGDHDEEAYEEYQEPNLGAVTGGTGGSMESNSGTRPDDMDPTLMKRLAHGDITAGVGGAFTGTLEISAHPDDPAPPGAAVGAVTPTPENLGGLGGVETGYPVDEEKFQETLLQLQELEEQVRQKQELLRTIRPGFLPPNAGPTPHARPPAGGGVVAEAPGQDEHLDSAVAKAKMEGLRQRLGATEAELDEIQQQCRQYERHKINLSEELTVITRELDELEFKYNEAMETEDRLRSELEQAQRLNDTITVSKALLAVTASEEIERLREMIALLREPQS